MHHREKGSSVFCATLKKSRLAWLVLARRYSMCYETAAAEILGGVIWSILADIFGGAMQSLLADFVFNPSKDFPAIAGFVGFVIVVWWIVKRRCREDVRKLDAIGQSFANHHWKMLSGEQRLGNMPFYPAVLEDGSFASDLCPLLFITSQGLADGFSFTTRAP